MENTLSQRELKEALLEALLEYDLIKKNRRLNSIKKTLQGTMVATLIGSAGLIAANPGRGNQVREKEAIISTSSLHTSQPTNLPIESSQSKFIPGVAHFGFNKHTLTTGQEERLLNLINQLPKNSEIAVIGRTDSRGSKKYNEKLGKLRAMAVADYLAERGIKIKFVGSRISNKMPENWMKRRVDIIVESPSTTVLLNSASPETPLVSKQIPPNSEPQNQTIINTFGFRREIPPETNRSPENGDVKQTLPENYTNTITKQKPVQAHTFREKIRGAAHFSLNSDELTWTNKQRLMDLIKQLPNDAVLTIVGRTESDDAENNSAELGMQRAKTVASFLSNFGVKINAVASKESSYGFTGWGARRVDIIIDSTTTQMSIDLPQPLQGYSYKIGDNTKNEDRPIAIEREAMPKRQIPNPYLYNVD
jgi:outer membrane protein OmpA-like peptidoglycan-associated protein